MWYTNTSILLYKLSLVLHIGAMQGRFAEGSAWGPDSSEVNLVTNTMLSIVCLQACMECCVGGSYNYGEGPGREYH